jgi:hypothetical protein
MQMKRIGFSFPPISGLNASRLRLPPIPSILTGDISLPPITGPIAVWSPTDHSRGGKPGFPDHTEIESPVPDELAQKSPNHARSPSATDHDVCLCASLRQDLTRTRREQVGVIVAYSASGVIRRLAARQSASQCRRDEACHYDSPGSDSRSGSAGHDPAVPSLGQL